MASKTLIAICGTTGVGKSRLAIELALSLPNGGSVINADAMQTYEGLDVLTNKIKPEEQRGVEHSLLSFKKPGEQYIVGEWIQDANNEIDRIHSRGKIPIIVGGTSYWIQHLLFSNGLPSRHNVPKQTPHSPSPTLSAALKLLPENLSQLYHNLPTDPPTAKDDPSQAFALHNLLSSLDPTMAARWHWKDTRKVLRNLEIIKENGRLATEVLVEAFKTNSQTSFKTLVFWLYAKPESLEERLDRRVEDMLSQGLLDEIRSLQSLAQSSSEVDYTSGIYQAIGYREFDNFLRSNESNTEKNQVSYNAAVEQMKINTRKYARRQIKWIRNKLLPAVNDSNSIKDDGSSTISTYLLDATDLDKWEINVLEIAKNISKDFLSGLPLPDPRSISQIASDMLIIHQGALNPAEVLKSRRKLICEVCTTDPEQPVMLEEGNEWEIHQRTRVHRRRTNSHSNINKSI